MTNPTREQLREQYFKLAKHIGIDEAISTLHNDAGALEPRVFDGGYDKDKMQVLQWMRELARDLMSLKLAEASQEYFTEKK